MADLRQALPPLASKIAAVKSQVRFRGGSCRP
jgi:hypothetical protein